MYRLQTQWVNCSTQTSYLGSLATWTDAAKDYYFNTATSGKEDVDHPFQLGDAPWVIRSHFFLFHEPRRYHRCTDYRTDLEISTQVTRVGKSSMDLEHQVCHELPGAEGHKLLCSIASSIIVFSPETGKPVPHGMDVHSSKCSKVNLEINRWLDNEANQTPAEAFQHVCQPRFSDLDGHGHVNNAVLLSYLQDARHAAACASMGSSRLDDLRSVYLEFLSMAGLGDTLTTVLWEPMPSTLLLRMTSGRRTILRARFDLGSPLAPAERVPAALQPAATASGTTDGLQQSLEAVVEQRRQRGLLRSLSTRQEQQVDFCSNDYLGFARSEELWQLVDAEIQELRSRSQQGAAKILLGSTGSRLLSGNSAYCEALEHDLAQFHRAESALIFNSGFDLNMGLFASVPQTGDEVFYDELIHQSVREGFKLSRAKGNVRAFPHNDVRALEQMLAQSRAEKPKANLIVAVESVYSMDGHLAPLEELCQVAAAWGASLIVDEAHGTGAYGEEGRGLVSALGLEAQVFCRVHTFGKALGVHGAVVVGPRVLREYLMNYAWPLVYSTSLPLHSLAAIRCAYAFMRQEASRRQDILRGLIQTFQSRLSRFSSQQVLESPSPIQGLIVPGNAACVRVAQQLRHRFDVLPIRSPTVPAGTERLRIILHAHNTEEEIHALMDAIEAALPTNASSDALKEAAAPISRL
ncbi:8-amino-7-oxononanoate synthase (AONS) (7-keto-8-amino-pelargonic acid synthase) (7-KAP synthase) (KAPA synthase) (8-amino-7-ketopelargonate synthase) [Durusdinium trenchii]|uniref:8-amino-7-oxononanoate synthase (AONS) (7-keto-8-amino-pelargonic acid synthase) (7-KAP synthase) (KAPA synthase) (8-amino-7-ketopelargonate synthase) n=1 Tax=Durusdinium trenchii TaxID=1381693 RepID=A0ABP0SGX1_9DINO